MKARAWLVGLLFLVVQATSAAEPQDLVGRRLWVRPSITETSVDFYGDQALRKRLPVRAKKAFVIEGVVGGGPYPHEEPIYRVRFGDGVEGFMAAKDLESRLYRELRQNEVANSPLFEPPLGQGVQVHQFERASVFLADPDVIWARVKNQGPRTLRVLPRGTLPRHADPVDGRTVVQPVDPTAPIIPPR
jgi:hypothetical protein